MVRQTTPDIIYVFRRNFQVKVISSIFHIGKIKTSFSPKNIFHQIKLLVIFSVKKLLSQNFCKNCELRNGKRKLISQSYNFKFQQNYTKKIVSFQNGQYYDASHDCRKAIRLKPEFIKAYIHLAKALKELGEFQEAIDILERAEEMSKEQAKIVQKYKLEMIEEHKKSLILEGKN